MPVIPAWNAHRYATVPAFLGVQENDCPGWSAPESNLAPALAVTVWLIAPFKPTAHRPAA